jgi:hypothetical protein
LTDFPAENSGLLQFSTLLTVSLITLALEETNHRYKEIHKPRDKTLMSFQSISSLSTLMVDVVESGQKNPKYMFSVSTGRLRH